MKSTLITALFVLVFNLSFSQTSKSVKIFLDSTWNETTEANHKYYRIISDYNAIKNDYKVRDYYKSGVLQMSGTTKDKDYLKRNGQFIYYYENGNSQSLVTFENDIANGKKLEWYENGSKKLEGEFIVLSKNELPVFNLHQFWDINGDQKVIDGNGNYEYSDHNHSESGKINNGFHDGIWKGQDKKLNFNYTENYENGKFISGVSIDSNKISHDYKEVESKPLPRKGIMDFYKYVAKNFKTPEIRGISGKIIIGFIVDKNGKIIEPKILKSIGYGTDEEAIRVVSKYENFIPGEIRGIKTNCKYSLPITIQPH